MGKTSLEDFLGTLEKGVGADRSLGLYYRTLRDLPARQIFRKAWFEAKTRLLQKQVPPVLRQRVLLGALPEIVPSARQRSSAALPKAINDSKKEFCFEYLNEARAFRSPVPWNAPDLSRLWKFHLHSFKDFDSQEAPREDLILDWISANPVGVFDAWHPYTTSLRIVAWTQALTAFDFSDRARIERSLWTQLVYLHRNKEYSVRGNHLLENLRALIVGALYFVGADADQLVEDSLTELCEELKVQVLEDGGHYELSSMYHLVMVDLVADVASSLVRAGRELPASLCDPLKRMIRFAESMRFADGSFPLWNDAAFGVSRPLDEVVADAREILAERPSGAVLQSSHLTASGYSLLRKGGFEVAFDYAWPCPLPLPGHGHADCLNVEIRYGGIPFVTETGTSQYAAGFVRQHERSTGAHNTLRVAGRNQSEVWGSFRVGRKARPSDCRQSDTDSSWAWAQGSHDGYENSKARPHRWVGTNGSALVVFDSLRAPVGTPFEILYHVAPDVMVTALGSNRYLLNKEGVSLGFAILGCDEGMRLRYYSADESASWYSPEFGRRIPRGLFVVEGKASDSRCHVCAVFGKNEELPDYVLEGEAQRARLRTPGLSTVQWTFRPAGLEVDLGELA